MHGKQHHDRHRQLTKGLLVFWLTQVVMWTILLAGAFLVPALRSLFEKVYWVSVLSLYANLTTVASIVAGLWAALAAGQAHEDAEAGAQAVRLDIREIDTHIAELAELSPGPEAQKLADEILQQLKA